MKIRLKPLYEQVVVITGASSGIGLATARAAARRGARLVLTSRNAQALEQLCEELRAHGKQAIHVIADVGSQGDVQAIADAAIAHFGGFDTWVNNAGALIYGRVEEIAIEDAQRLFDTNFWGAVYGSRIAARHLKQRGGAIINVGSDLSEHTAPLMGFYSASKHAVMGITDALRLELHKEGAPIAVTLVRPAGIDTQAVMHAKNYLEVEPTLPPPVYAPSVVAEAILHAAEHETRDIFAGGAARLNASLTHFFPRISDWVMRTFMFDALRTSRAARGPHDGLHTSAGSALAERGGIGADRFVLDSSLYTKAVTHRTLTRLAALGVGLAAAAAIWGSRLPRHR